jgi:glycosyltransferase involved in cell wall biosynthesis
MDLPDDIEIIIMDDGSDPPLYYPPFHNFTLFQTKDYRNWTNELARNKGVEMAKGEYVLLTDIDHILTKEAVIAAYKYEGDKLVFLREFGVLDVYGKVCTTNLEEYGWIGGKRAVCHSNTFCIRKTIFKDLGGYAEKWCVTGKHISRAERTLNNRWDKASAAGTYKIRDIGPVIYMYPVGRYHKNGETNPLGLFHGLPYEV